MGYNPYEVYGETLEALQAAIDAEQASAQRLSEKLYTVTGKFLRQAGMHRKGIFDATTFGIPPELIMPSRRTPQKGYRVFTESAAVPEPGIEELANVDIIGIGENLATILIKTEIAGAVPNILLLNGFEGKHIVDGVAYPVDYATITTYTALVRRIANANNADPLSLGTIA